MMNSQVRYLFLEDLSEEDEFNRREILAVFGENLRRLRTLKGLTQERLAELADLNPKYIGEIERGEKNPTALVLYRLAHALSVSVSEILSTDGHYLSKAPEIKEKVERLFEGKDEKEIKRAIRILEVLFE